MGRYHIARQAHVGDALDELTALGRLRWRWGYDVPRRRAIFHVCDTDGQWSALDTRSAEELVQRHFDDLGIPWIATANPGGVKQREAALAWIERERAGEPHPQDEPDEAVEPKGSPRSSGPWWEGTGWDLLRGASR